MLWGGEQARKGGAAVVWGRPRVRMADPQVSRSHGGAGGARSASSGVWVPQRSRGGRAEVERGLPSGLQVHTRKAWELVQQLWHLCAAHYPGDTHVSSTRAARPGMRASVSGGGGALLRNAFAPTLPKHTVSYDAFVMKAYAAAALRSTPLTFRARCPCCICTCMHACRSRRHRHGARRPTAPRGGGVRRGPW